jgi:hypothetical protein
MILRRYIKEGAVERLRGVAARKGTQGVRHGLDARAESEYLRRVVRRVKMAVSAGQEAG